MGFEIIIDNRIKIKEIDRDYRNALLIETLTKELTLVNPAYDMALKHGRDVRNINPKILNYRYFGKYLAIPYGYIDRLFYLIDSLQIETSIIDNKPVFENDIKIKDNIKHRAYQKPAVEEMVKHKSGILQAPAGSGKTVMGISIIERLKLPTLWLTHTDALLDQTIDRIATFTNIEPGKIKGKIDIRDITVGMVQTLVRRRNIIKEIYDKFGLIILDEAHHCPARTFKDIIMMFNCIHVYGLTATPYRADGLQGVMKQVLGPIRYVIPKSEVIKHGGIILPDVYYRIFTGSRISDNDYTRILNGLIDNEIRNNIIINDVLKEARDDSFCIVLTDRKAHCEVLYKILKEKYDRCEYIHGNDSKKRKEKIIGLLRDKKINVLISTSGLLGEGFDIPFLDAAFICLPFRAKAKLEQVIGRVQRPYDGKKSCRIYDYVDNHIGILSDQFYNRKKTGRFNIYQQAGLKLNRLY